MAGTTEDLAQETILPDEGLVTTEFIAFLKTASEKHHPTGALPRCNQRRAAACVDAAFLVPADPISESVNMVEWRLRRNWKEPPWLERPKIWPRKPFFPTKVSSPPSSSPS